MSIFDGYIQMSEKNADQQEPSIEEILASVRRIISEDEADEDILELTEALDEEPEPEREPEEVEDDRLVSDEVEEVSAASISGLTEALAASARLGDGDKTLEQLVKEVLRPILKEWLEANLSEIVERIVRDEVERISSRVKK